jgi:SAM-dependent methyltransferase
VSEPAWKAVNRAHWDEKVALHIGPRGYDLTSLRAGRGRLNAIEEAELWPVDGKRILHLQCHFGADSLKLVQRDATVVGLDFSAAAIDAARQLASELGLADRARFVQADLYDAPKAIPEPAEFDMVFVTWGAIGWLPDIRRWAEIVAHFLKPGGSLYLADAHPTAMVFDDAASLPDGRPGFFAPYFSREPVVMEEAHDYIDETTTVVNSTTHTWIHPISDIISSLLAAGLTLKPAVSSPATGSA